MVLTVVTSQIPVVGETGAPWTLYILIYHAMMGCFLLALMKRGFVLCPSCCLNQSYYNSPKYRPTYGHLAVDQVLDGQTGNARHFLE